MTKLEFSKLKAGDVVIWNPCSKRPSFRTVSEGPQDDPRWDRSCDIDDVPSGHLHVYFPIKHSSWTRKSFTTYSFSDIGNKIKATGRNIRSLVSEHELERLLAMRMTPRFDIEQEQYNCIRMGRKCMRRLAALAQRTIQSLEFAEIK